MSLLDLHTILSVVRSVVTLLQGSLINLASAAEILHICKLAIMKLRQIGWEFWQLLWAASIELAENGIEVIIEKQKMCLQKVTVEMSKD